MAPIRMTKGRVVLLSTASAAVLALVAAALTSKQDSSRISAAQNIGRMAAVLNSGNPSAMNSFYSCIINGRQQGLSLDQARADCLPKLDQKGNSTDNGLDAALNALGLGGQNFFDPSTIVADCSAGNGKVGQSASSSGWQQTPGWGSYSWGGDANHHYQYSKEQSEAYKKQAIAEAVDATEKFEKLEDEADKAEGELQEAKKSGDQAKIDDAQKKFDDASKAAKDAAKKGVEAREKAREDPNEKPQSNSRPVAGDSECELALQEAREILFRCNKSDWKSSDCQQLLAKMHDCPDPTTILVDPDQGYVCSDKIDGEALKAAWIERCESRKKFGPDGNPCVPPTIDMSARFGNGLIFDICNDPRAYIDPDSNECRAVVTTTPFGEPNLHDLIVWGLNKLGGPIIILNRDPPSPEPQPRPGPGPGPGSGDSQGRPDGRPGPVD